MFKRFRGWVKADVFQALFDAVSEPPDMEYAVVNATIVKCTGTVRVQKKDFVAGHRSLAGWVYDQELALTDALSNLVMLLLMPGQRHRHDPPAENAIPFDNHLGCSPVPRLVRQAWCCGSAC